MHTHFDKNSNAIFNLKTFNRHIKVCIEMLSIQAEVLSVCVCVRVFSLAVIYLDWSRYFFRRFLNDYQNRQCGNHLLWICYFWPAANSIYVRMCNNKTTSGWIFSNINGRRTFFRHHCSKLITGKKTKIEAGIVVFALRYLAAIRNDLGRFSCFSHQIRFLIWRWLPLTLALFSLSLFSLYRL